MGLRALMGLGQLAGIAGLVELGDWGWARGIEAPMGLGRKSGAGTGRAEGAGGALWTVKLGGAWNTGGTGGVGGAGGTGGLSADPAGALAGTEGPAGDELGHPCHPPSTPLPQGQEHPSADLRGECFPAPCPAQFQSFKGILATTEYLQCDHEGTDP